MADLLLGAVLIFALVVVVEIWIAAGKVK